MSPSAPLPPAATGPESREVPPASARSPAGRRSWRAVFGAVSAAVALVGGGWWWATAPPPGVSREVAGLIHDLQRRPAVHQRLAVRVVAWIHPTAPRWLPRFLQADRVDLKRLEACHRLIALGPATRPAAPALARAFAHPDPTVSFYAFLVLVHSTAPAATVVTLARDAWATASGPVFFYAGLLTTEDERLRDFAWECLEAAGEDALVVADRLRELAAEGDPAIRDRARRLLRRLGQEPNAASPELRRL